MKKQLLYVVAALVLAQPVFAATNPWLGTWKLNRDKSTMTGDTYTVTKKGALYHQEYGPVQFDIGEDGKDYPTSTGYTASMKPTGKNEWLTVGKKDGVEVNRSVMILSDDGKTLTSKTTGTRADGSTYKMESVDERISGGPGLAGTFRSKTFTSSATSIMIYSDAGTGKLKVDYPSSKASIVFSLDGKPTVETGPRADPDETLSMKQVSPTELHKATQVKGKPLDETVLTVSPDGKTLKEVVWLVTKPNEKTTLIFEKQ